MMYFIDTNTCVYFLKGKYPSIAEEFKKHKPEEIKIPSMVKAELLFGVEKSKHKEKNLEACNEFLEPFDVMAFDDRSTPIYGKLRSLLERKGSPVGPNDMIIAATVMARNGVLITHNINEFKKIDGLALEDWVRE